MPKPTKATASRQNDASCQPPPDPASVSPIGEIDVPERAPYPAGRAADMAAVLSLIDAYAEAYSANAAADAAHDAAVAELRRLRSPGLTARLSGLLTASLAASNALVVAADDLSVGILALHGVASPRDLGRERDGVAFAARGKVYSVRQSDTSIDEPCLAIFESAAIVDADGTLGRGAAANPARDAEFRRLLARWLEKDAEVKRVESLNYEKEGFDEELEAVVRKRNVVGSRMAAIACQTLGVEAAGFYDPVTLVVDGWSFTIFGNLDGWNLQTEMPPGRALVIGGGR